MFQQRQLSNRVLTCQLMQPHQSNRATSPTNLRNATCRIMQPHLPNRATPAVDLCNASYRLEYFSRRFISFWKNFTKRRRRRSHARFVVGLLILLVLLILLIYKERGLIINELRGVKLNGSSTVLSRLFNERFISNEKTHPWRPLFYGKKWGQNISNSSSLGVSFFKRIPERFFRLSM